MISDYYLYVSLKYTILNYSMTTLYRCVHGLVKLQSNRWKFNRKTTFKLYNACLCFKSAVRLLQIYSSIKHVCGFSISR